MPPFSLALALGLALVHLYASRLRFLAVVPRSAWLSAAGGGSVAYVFVHLLPELASGQYVLAEALPLTFLEAHVWIVALTGLVTFYGLEQAALRGREEAEGGEGTEVGVFWVHVGVFSLYNALIGYLLVHEGPEGTAQQGLFGLAMALHLFVNDDGLRRHHQERYTQYGRWILAAAVLAGWAVGALSEMHEALVAVLLAFLGGGLVLNVLKEELPEERASRFWPFALGAASYAVLMLVIGP